MFRPALLRTRLKPTQILRFASTKKKELTEIQPSNLGVAQEQFVPARFSNYPSLLTSPKTWFNGVIRRVYHFGMNQVQVALFRYQASMAPSFLLWINKAIESYVQVNQAFAKKDKATIKNNSTLWVQEALSDRMKSIPEDVRLEWQLVKFNEKPKLITFQSLLIPGRPLDLVKIIYRINSKQRLIKLDKNNKVDTLERDVIDYPAFIIDIHTNEVLLCGTVFENKAGDKMPKNLEDNMSITMARMKECGDIFRVKPKD